MSTRFDREVRTPSSLLIDEWYGLALDLVPDQYLRWNLVDIREGCLNILTGVRPSNMEDNADKILDAQARIQDMQGRRHIQSHQQHMVDSVNLLIFKTYRKHPSMFKLNKTGELPSIGRTY